VIVGKHVARMIEQGRATELRRRVDEHDYAVRQRRGRSEVRKPVVYERGQRKAIKVSRVAEAACHILLTACHKERHGEVTYNDAVAMGFKTREQYKAYWVRLFDVGWVQRHEPTINKPDGTSEREILPDGVLADRFDARHADNEVWVLTFEVERDTPLLLAANSDELYVSTPGRAMEGEPEAINTARLRPHWEDEAAQRRAAARGHRDLVARRRSVIGRVRKADPALLDAIEEQLNQEADAA
jgi:hypothetical protein